MQTNGDSGWAGSVPPAVAGGCAAVRCKQQHELTHPPATAGGTDPVQARLTKPTASLATYCQPDNLHPV